MVAPFGFEPKPYASEAGVLETPVLTITLQGIQEIGRSGGI